MKKTKKKPEWKLISHSYQIADTGDYDGHYEVSNGKISLFTKDDDDETLTEITQVLNTSGIEFYQDDAAEFELKLLKEEIAQKSLLDSILFELLKNKIKIEIDYDSTYEVFTYTVYGFYKSGSVTLIPIQNCLQAHSRYNEVDEITSVKDLILLNLTWWKRSKDRYDGWKLPDSRWIPLMERYNLIEVKTETTQTYSTK